MRSASEVYSPPRPSPLSALLGLARTAAGGEGNLLGLLPASAYRVPAGWLGWSRRGILLVNAPELTRPILDDPRDVFPKSDLMVGALAPLVGESIFVSSGERWRRQRRMTNPAFSHMRLNRAFGAMAAAVDECERRLDERVADGRRFSLDLAMSHLTADIICRTVFSASLQSEVAREVFEAFTTFERSVAHVRLKRLIFDPAWRAIAQPEHVLAACATIRCHLGALVDAHLAAHPGTQQDIAAALVAARDDESGTGFSREELIDQLGVFFLAGHETTASVLTWCFFILARQPQTVLRIRREVAEVAGGGPVELDHVKRLGFTRSVFSETLRLYPPIPFLPRVALESGEIGGHRIKRGAMIMISPWTIHRHRDYWRDPHVFDPDRFAAGRESEIAPGTYLPFGIGPRVCMGAGFAAMEGTLILARLACRYDFAPESPERVRPVARLTIRPAREIHCAVRHASAS